MKISTHAVDELKASGFYYSAGALAFALSHDNSYGCHFGMKSDYSRAKAEFAAGYQAAQLATPVRS